MLGWFFEKEDAKKSQNLMESGEVDRKRKTIWTPKVYSPVPSALRNEIPPIIYEDP